MRPGHGSVQLCPAASTADRTHQGPPRRNPPLAQTPTAPALEGNVPRPLAVGLVEHAPSDSEYERSCARVAVSLRAREEGYALVELFELLGVPRVDRGVLVGVGEVVARGEVRAVFVSGVEVGGLPEWASGLVVVEVPVVLGSRELLLGSAVGWSEGCEGGGLL
jgi:hypothetical protein